MTNHTPIKPPKWVLRRIDENLDYNSKTGNLIWNKDLNNRTKKGSIAGTVYVYVKVGFTDRKAGKKTIKFQGHHIAWYKVTGKWPTVGLDHRNGDKTDNGFKNLREATHSQNMRNKSKHKRNGSSKYKGVSWCAPNKSWKARIRVNGKLIHLGSYKVEESAMRAYRKAAKKYFGEFAYQKDA